MSHTPGPWTEVRIHGDNLDYYMIAADDSPTNSVATRIWEPADARLIAAAPDLLRALELLLNDRKPDGRPMLTHVIGAAAVLKRAKAQP
jgi:hypothetical protein